MGRRSMHAHMCDYAAMPTYAGHISGYPCNTCSISESDCAASCILLENGIPSNVDHSASFDEVRHCLLCQGIGHTRSGKQLQRLSRAHRQCFV
mmetsp:Transcript_22552/g.67161  ORF Transcript_22552/g.67161 Transcript_22552/m.67161 type:complete len:93 (-) Transcript_22552:203-481(-)